MTLFADVLIPVMEVNPVPWARAQMAFTLAFQIILVPLGVSWAALALIANYRAHQAEWTLTHLRLAQRWSKYMAVTFAIGAVTGTALLGNFEFGLLGPSSWVTWVRRSACLSPSRACSSSTAVFISIYISAGARPEPWTHFWTGVPIAVAGMLGSASVVAANAWMNSPAGGHSRLLRQRRRGRPAVGDPQRCGSADGRARMVLAAYLVGGFLIALVYAPACCVGEGTATTGSGSSSPSPSPQSPPLQMGSATAWLVGSTTTSPPSSPPSRWCRRPQPCARNPARPSQLRDVEGVSPSRGCLVVVGSQHRPGDRGCRVSTAYRRRAPDHPRGQRRPSLLGHHGRSRHAPVPVDALVRALDLRRDMPRSEWFLRGAAISGILAVVTWRRLDGERGRSPALDRL